TFSGYYLAGEMPELGTTEERTSAVLVLFLVALWVLVILTRPLNEWKVGLLVAVGLAFVATMSVPWSRDFFALESPPTLMTMAAIGVAAVAIAVLEAGWQLIDWR